MSRARRFVQGVSLSYFNQLLITAIGIWLTPFLLRHLGDEGMGVWLIVTQIIAWLGLLDLGVIALVPRETAFAVGRGGGIRESTEVAPVLGRTLRLIAWQLPVLAAGATALWFLMPADWEGARGVLVPILIVFVVCWPFRMVYAALEGLQQLRVAARIQLVMWAVQTLLTVGLVLGGYGLAALAWAWAVGQIGTALLSAGFFLARFPQHVPRTLPTLSRRDVREHLARGGALTVSQLTTTLIFATDLFVIARVMGPEALIPYAMTAKLVSVLQNQPQILMHAATPALAELRAAGMREHAGKLVMALGTGLLLVSGAIALVVTVINEGFVSWWVGPSRFGGMALTLAVVGMMLLRHLNLVMLYAAFVFGRERRIMLIGVGDGIVTVLGMVVLVSLLGPIGAPLGSIAGATLVSLPQALRIVGRDTLLGTRVLLRHMVLPVVVRLSILLAAAVALAQWWTPRGVIALAIAGAVAALVYAAVMLPVLMRSSLAEYLRGRLPARIMRRLDSIAGPRPVPQP